MESFTDADIDSGYAAVTPRLYIGRPPFHATNPDGPVIAKELMEAGEDVYFYDSESCYVTLILLGMTHDAATARLCFARFGPLGAD